MSLKQVKEPQLLSALSQKVTNQKPILRLLEHSPLKRNKLNL